LPLPGTVPSLRDETSPEVIQIAEILSLVEGRPLPADAEPDPESTYRIMVSEGKERGQKGEAAADGAVAADGQAHRFAGDEAEGFIVGTITAFGKQLMEQFANAHGVGLLWKAAELAFKAMEWCRVGEGEDTVEVSAPIPLGFGVDLEVSVHPSNGQNGLPLTLCMVPSDASTLGVFEVKGFEIGPGEERAREPSPSRHAGDANVSFGEQSPQLGNLDPGNTAIAAVPEAWLSSTDDGDRDRLFEIVSADLSPEERTDADGVAALARLAEQERVELRSRLRPWGTRFVVLYDPAARRVLWVRLDDGDDASPPRWRISITVDPTTGWLSKPEVDQT
jgi:hypothetical protein